MTDEAKDLFGDGTGLLKLSAVNTNPRPLTAEDLTRAFEGLERRERRRREAPGPCGCGACVVSPTTMERLRREGGYATCASCGSLFRIIL